MEGEWEALHKEFIEWEEQGVLFGGKFVDGFSSARFLDILTPLIKLPDSVKESLRSRLHGDYLTQTKVTCLVAPYEKTLKSLRTSLQSLRDAWKLPRPDGADMLQKSAAEVIVCAAQLRDILERIPKGLVLL
jgi:hypothetical protein